MITRHKLTLLISFLLFVSCSPSKKIIDSSNHDKIEQLNKRLIGKDVEVVLVNGNSFKTDSTRLIDGKLLHFAKKGETETALTKIRFLKVKPNISTSAIVGISLITYGGVASYLYLNGNISGEHLATKTSLPALLGGIGVLVVGNSTETEIYYFK